MSAVTVTCVKCDYERTFSNYPSVHDAIAWAYNVLSTDQCDGRLAFKEVHEAARD